MSPFGSERRWRPRPPPLSLLILTAIVIVTVLDWSMPQNIVLGILLALPIAMTASLDDERWVWGAALVAVCGMLVAMHIGPPRVPPAPDGEAIAFGRLLALLAILFSATLAVVLQRRRREAERARDEAIAAGSLNRILVALIAHDLRAPLVLAEQALTYSYENAVTGRSSDPELLADVSARLGRSLRTIEGILAVARHDVRQQPTPGLAARPLTTNVKEELTDELRAFEREARDRGKTIVADLQELGDVPLRIDGLLVRQVIGILVDNAIRYAPPGQIRVSARQHDGDLVLAVADGGKVPQVPADVEPGGAGLGLELCRAIAVNAGGSLTIHQTDTGRTCTLRLPLGVTPSSVPMVPAAKPARL